MKRVYEILLNEHFLHYQQMLLLMGPRQVGKTTISLTAKNLTTHFTYLNWDNYDHRQLILQGPAFLANYLGLNKLYAKTPIVVFDEIHKYGKWKSFLKGFFDTYKNQVHIIVTGSSKLTVFKAGGDSLMGRYFPYRIHPISVAECARTKLTIKEIQTPKSIDPKIFNDLYELGGFPEPFLKKDLRFARRWRRLRQQQLFQEDIRDLSNIQEIAQLEFMAELIKHQVGGIVSYSNLATKANISVDTVRRWLKVLETFYYCFSIKPWSKNITRSLIKGPKIYLWDWSELNDIGAKTENFIAVHLLKAVHFWTDQGFGDYDLFFLRDKEKREVDFLVTKNHKPWFLVEVKQSANAGLSKYLYFYQKQTNAQHAFQLAFDMPFVAKDCFQHTDPIIVPAQTFLSQLV